MNRILIIFVLTFLTSATHVDLRAWESSSSSCYAWNDPIGTPLGNVAMDMSLGGFSLTGYSHTNFNSCSKMCGYYHYKADRYTDLKTARDLFVYGLRNFVRRINEHPEQEAKWQIFPLSEKNIDYVLKFNDEKSPEEAPLVRSVLFRSNHQIIYIYRNMEGRRISLHEESWEEAVSRVESASLSEALAKLALTREEAMERFYGIKQPDPKYARVVLQ